MKTIQSLFSIALLLSCTSFANDDYTIRILEGPKEALQDLAFSADGELAIGTTLNSGIWIWKTETGELAHNFMEAKGLFVGAISVSPGGQRFASSLNSDGVSSIGVWNVLSGDELLRFENAGRTESFKFSPDANLFLSTGTELEVDPESGEFKSKLEVRVWDAATSEQLFAHDLGHLSVLDKKAIDFTPDSSKIIVPTGKKLIILDSHTGQLFREYNHSVDAARVSPDQKRLIAIGSEGFSQPTQILIWDFEDAGSDVPIKTINIEYHASDILFHPNGETFLISPGFDENNVVVRRTETGDVVLELKEPGELEDQPLSSSCARFVAEGTIIVSSYEGKASLWNSTTGEKILDLPRHGTDQQGCNIRITPDGNFAMTYLEGSRDDWTARLIDLRKEEE